MSFKEQRRRFFKLKRDFPRSEFIALLTPLFKSLRSSFPDYERARCLLEILAPQLDVAEKHLANARRNIEVHLKHIDEKKSKPDNANRLWLEQNLNQARKDGTLLRGSMLAEYAGLLDRYEYDASARAATDFSLDAELTKITRLCEYVEAYRFLYQNYFQLFAHIGKGLLHEAIAQLRAAIRTDDLFLAQSATEKARSLLQPTRVVSIPQLRKGGIFTYSIDIIGIAHQLTELEVFVNGERRQRAQAAIDGAFQFTRVRLGKGENIIRIASASVPPLLFNDTLCCEFELACKAALFMLTRIDPLTKAAFDEVEIENWVRCQKCQTLSLRISWEEYGDRCYICNSSSFWEHAQPEFHEEEVLG